MIVVGISGASGPIMGIRLIEELLNSNERVAAIVSQAAGQIIEYEMFMEKESFFILERAAFKTGPFGQPSSFERI